MTSITITKDEHLIRGFLVQGHSGFKPCGEDVLCAAISMLAINTVNALMMVVGLQPEDITKLEVDESTPRIGLVLSRDIPKEKQKQCQLLMETFELGMKSLVDHPLYRKHIVLKYRRKNDD